MLGATGWEHRRRIVAVWIRADRGATSAGLDRYEFNCQAQRQGDVLQSFAVVWRDGGGMGLNISQMALSKEVRSGDASFEADSR